MKKLFANNRFLIVFAAVCSLLLYIMVSITTNDSRTRMIYNVPVKLDTTNATLTNQRLNLVDEVEYFTDIEVYGPLSAIDDLTANSPELLTTVRLNNITEPGTYEPTLVSGYEGGGEALPFSIESYSPDKIMLTFDRQVGKDFTVEPVVNGVKTSPPYVFDNQYASPETVRVTGPENELARVSSAAV
jgi:YbbR domain-containing protein